MSRQCNQCSTYNRDTAKFCQLCGLKLSAPPQDTVDIVQEQTCPSCNTGNLPAACFCHQCATPLQTGHATLHTGLLGKGSSLAERYVIVKKVGQGGMGAVYQASDTHLGHQVLAIKEMSEAALTDPLDKQQGREAFEQEAQLLAKLSHPNLPRVTDHFRHGGKQYLVMDFIEGYTVEQMLNQAPLNVAQVVTWAIQLCDVLEYLHNQQPPIIFRDLKPANIMVNQSGQIKLIDFGIARLFKKNQSNDTNTLGTVGYAPPEQYGKAQTDPRSDIYALGVTMHHLLTGQDPKHTSFNFTPVRLLNAEVPEAVEQVVMRAVNPQAERRWQNAPEMRDAITRALSTLPKTAEKEPQNLLSIPTTIAPKENEPQLAAQRPVLWLRMSLNLFSLSPKSKQLVWLSQMGATTFSLILQKRKQIAGMAVTGALIGLSYGGTNNESQLMTLNGALLGGFFAIIGWTGTAGALLGAALGYLLESEVGVSLLVGAILGVLLGKRGWATIMGALIGMVLGAVFAEDMGALLGIGLGALIAFKSVNT